MRVLWASPWDLPRWEGPLSHPFYSKVVKRALDLGTALLLLPLFLLLMLPIALLVKITSRGPVLYRALRGGYHNKPFYILKFRTMVVGADQYSGTTAPDDPCDQVLGRCCARPSWTRFRRFWNILKGTCPYRPQAGAAEVHHPLPPGTGMHPVVRPGISDPSSLKLISLDAAVATTTRRAPTSGTSWGEERDAVAYAKANPC